MNHPKLDQSFALLSRLYLTGNLDNISAATTVFQHTLRVAKLDEKQAQQEGYSAKLPNLKPLTNLMSKEELEEMLR
jgi:hypothetical protein